MIKHIVMMRLVELDIREKEFQRRLIKEKLEALQRIVPSLISMEVGLNTSDRDIAFDLVLVSTFKDEAGLEAYLLHPEHILVLNYLRSLVKETAVTDYYLD
jgi:hypothetical protein